MLLALPDVALLSGSFALEDRWLLWSRILLYPDRLELAGWSLTGRLQRQIPLTRIEETDHADERLQLDLEGEGEMEVHVDEPARWARLIRAQRTLRK